MTLQTVAQDTALRANQSGWGTSSDGQVWSTDSSLSIVSNELQCTSASTGSVNMTLGSGQITNGDLYVRFSIQSISLDNGGFTVRYVNSTNLVRVQIHSGNITVRVVVAGVGTNLSPTTGVTMTSGTFYWAHLNMNGNVYSVNVWPDGQSEPAGWVCQATDSGNNFIQPSKFGLFATVGVANDVIKFDSFLVTADPPTIYVSTSGNDSTGDGSLGNPYLTLQQAGTVAQAGSTVTMLPGIYNMTTTPTLNSNGTATARIIYQSQVRWGALLRMTTDNDVVINNGNYVDIVGFDCSGQGNGCIRTNASFASIRQNYCHDNPCPDAATTGGAGIVDHYNTGAEGDNDIIGNWIQNVGTAGIGPGLVHGVYHQTHRGHVQNNIILNTPAGWGIKCSYYAESAIISNNLMALGQAGGFLVVTDPVIGITMDHITFTNNIIRDNQGPFGSAIHEGTSPPAGATGVNNVYDHNCIYGGTTSTSLNNSLVVTNTVSADPQLVNYLTNGAGDYHLLSTSPCKDAGTSNSAATTDYDSNGRPQGTGYDIGPYEFVPGAIVPCRIFISGSPVFVIAGSLNFSGSIGKNSQASFNVQSDNNTHFQQDQQVRIVDQTSTLVFTGYVTTPKEQKPGFQPTLEHTLTCTNQHRLAEKRLVAASYVNKSPGYMVNDIYTNILAAEGVTVGLIYDAAALTDLFPDTTVFPSTTLYPTENVGIVPEATFVYCTVAQAFDALVTSASASGVPYYWQIDQYKQLWFAPYTAVVNNNTIDGTQIDDGRLTGNPPIVTRANPAYRNTQYLLGGVAQTVSQTNIRVGDGNTTAFTMDYDLSTVPTVSTNLNGAGYVAKTVGIQGVDTGKDWYWQKGSPLITQDSAGTKLRGPTGTVDLLKVVYVGQYPTVIIDQNNAQISYEAGLDGTTGIVEEAETDSTISSLANGLAKTSTILTRYAVQGTIFEGLTLQTGYAPGQLVPFDLPDHQLFNVQMLIEDVSGSDQLDRVNIWYTIKAVLGPYDVSWVDFFSTLLQQQTPSNSINVGVGQSVVIAVSGSASLSPTVTGSATPFACPIPSTSLFPDVTLFPC